jgi:hypothetical protein
MTIIPASGRLRQEYFKFEANLHSIVRYHLKKKKTAAEEERGGEESERKEKIKKAKTLFGENPPGFPIPGLSHFLRIDCILACFT